MSFDGAEGGAINIDFLVAANIARFKKDITSD